MDYILQLKDRVAKWIKKKKKKTRLYAAYKRFTSDVRIHTDWKLRDGKRYPMQMETKGNLGQGYLYPTK